MYADIPQPRTVRGYIRCGQNPVYSSFCGVAEHVFIIMLKAQECSEPGPRMRGPGLLLCAERMVKVPMPPCPGTRTRRRLRCPGKAARRGPRRAPTRLCAG